ncbi:CHAT domain-containing tetratricopeptide repeat protein [Halomicronema hongdechloris]|nr:CHAT domain-containing protein [Halomicronema hongdechloris]
MTTVQLPAFSQEPRDAYRLAATETKTETNQANEQGTLLLEVEGILEVGDNTLESGRLIDGHQFEGQADQIITIRLTSDEFDPFLAVLEPSGQVLGSRNNISVSNLNAALTIRLPKSGTYLVGVTIGSDDISAQGQYRLTVAEATTTEISKAEAERLLQLGIEQYQTARLREAIQSWEQALITYREIDDRQGEAVVLGNLGVAYRDLGDYQQAINLHEQALFIFREIGNRFGEVSSLLNLGGDYESLGNYQQAINLHEQSLTIAREINDRAGEGNSLRGLGAAYRNLGQYQQAIEFYEQSLAIIREIGDRLEETRALLGLGVTHYDLGNYERAIEFYEQSLAIIREIGDRLEEARVLGNLGNVSRTLGQYRQAIDLYKQRLTIAREIGDRPGEAAALLGMGNTYSKLGNYEQAIDLYRQSLAITREIGDRPGEAMSLHNQGLTFMNTGQLPQAESVLRQSIEVFESLRTNLPDNQLISIADTQARAYANLERALTAQDKTAEALAITERGRARAFVLQLASRLATPEEQAALADSPIAEAPTVAEIQQIARNTNTTLVTYSLIFDQALYIWVVQPSGEIQFRSVEFNGAGGSGVVVNPIAAIDGPVYRGTDDPSELDSLVADSRAGIIVERTGTNPAQLQELHRVLIEPIAALLPTDPEEKVAFIPQGNLFLVPFATLQDDDGTALIEKHTILTAPSIQVFGLANDVSGEPTDVSSSLSASGDGALIVGNPVMPTVWAPTASGDFGEIQLADLPGAKREAEAVGDVFGVPVLTGNQATEATVKQRLPAAQLIHLATHGLLEYGDPQSSGVLDVPGAVALTPGSGEDGLLTAAEILEMKLQAELAVLSACDTGRGRITGDGVVGLSRALITAGVPSVIVSLWAVPDAPTAMLMTEFYRQLDQGHDKAQALRQAMLITREQHPNPRAWAAFSLMGAAN